MSRLQNIRKPIDNIQTNSDNIANSTLTKETGEQISTKDVASSSFIQMSKNKDGLDMNPLLPATGDTNTVVTKEGTKVVDKETIKRGDETIGTATVRQGDETEDIYGTTKRKNVHAISYEGGDFDVRWMQFVHVSLIMDQLNTKTNVETKDIYGEGNFNASNGPMEFTTDPNAPKWALDVVPGSRSPYYGNSGEAVSSTPGAELTIFDMPGGSSLANQTASLEKNVMDNYQSRLTKVNFRQIFDTYLVDKNTGKSLYKTSWTAETIAVWDENTMALTVPTDQDIVYTNTYHGASPGINTAQKEILKNDPRFAAYSFD